jgi:hypothetical protein
MLRELAEKAKQINVKQLALQVVKANAGLIKTRLREQLTVGENGQGSSIGRYKSDYYARLKQRMGSQATFGTVDLKYSGNLYEKLEVAISEQSVSIDSAVDYSRYQIQRYGKSIYEIQDENQKDISFINGRDLAAEYSKALGL